MDAAKLMLKESPVLQELQKEDASRYLRINNLVQQGLFDDKMVCQQKKEPNVYGALCSKNIGFCKIYRNLVRFFLMGFHLLRKFHKFWCFFYDRNFTP